MQVNTCKHVETEETIQKLKRHKFDFLQNGEIQCKPPAGKCK